MTREEAIKTLSDIDKAWRNFSKEEYVALEMAIKALRQKPSNDTVSCGVFEQAMWERDVAIEQLKELGYGLGAKIKTDKDVISRQAVLDILWHTSFRDDYEYKVCKNKIIELPLVNPQPICEEREKGECPYYAG